VSSYLTEEYSREITGISYKEIERLAIWARMRGPQFYLIGGWAAWSYHRGLGSKDIDVVFLNQSLLEPFLMEFYRENGYERMPGLIESSYRKPVQVGSRTLYIEIDAAQIDRGQPFHENRALNLPYSLLQQHHQTWRAGQEEVLRPTVELLLLQKVKALRDRSWDLDHSSPDAARTQYLRGKIQKDIYDIQNLSTHLADWQVVTQIADSHGCRDIVSDSLRHLGIASPL
jgi:hypothetical protein